MARVILVQRERRAGQGSLVFGGPRSFLLPDSALPVVLIMLLYVAIHGLVLLVTLFFIFIFPRVAPLDATSA